MGNCMETCTHTQSHEEETERCREFVTEEDVRKNGLRVKVVLTKEELKWLVFQLNQKKGKKGLDQVLQEIERGRARIIQECWKPSLESILEVPEMER